METKRSAFSFGVNRVNNSWHKHQHYQTSKTPKLWELTTCSCPRRAGSTGRGRTRDGKNMNNNDNASKY